MMTAMTMKAAVVVVRVQVPLLRAALVRSKGKQPELEPQQELAALLLPHRLLRRFLLQQRRQLLHQLMQQLLLAGGLQQPWIAQSATFGFRAQTPTALEQALALVQGQALLAALGALGAPMRLMRLLLVLEPSLLLRTCSGFTTS